MPEPAGAVKQMVTMPVADHQTGQHHSQRRRDAADDQDQQFSPEHPLTIP
ncbi:MAG: hypothetical protein ACFHWZ_15065 [Phycisphaerales bacterium]